MIQRHSDDTVQVNVFLEEERYVSEKKKNGMSKIDVRLSESLRRRAVRCRRSQTNAGESKTPREGN